MGIERQYQLCTAITRQKQLNTIQNHTTVCITGPTTPTKIYQYSTQQHYSLHHVASKHSEGRRVQCLQHLEIKTKINSDQILKNRKAVWFCRKIICNTITALILVNYYLFGNMYILLIYCVLYCVNCVFVLVCLCIFILICFVCTSVRTTATEWKFNCTTTTTTTTTTTNNNNNNNNNVPELWNSERLTFRLRSLRWYREV
jgi:hypothetical protein